MLVGNLAAKGNCVIGVVNKLELFPIISVSMSAMPCHQMSGWTCHKVCSMTGAQRHITIWMCFKLDLCIWICLLPSPTHAPEVRHCNVAAVDALQGNCTLALWGGSLLRLRKAACHSGTVRGWAAAALQVQGAAAGICRAHLCICTKCVDPGIRNCKLHILVRIDGLQNRIFVSTGLANHHSHVQASQCISPADAWNVLQTCHVLIEPLP
mmetsp:Transcript_9252/g.22021  ORF Transcript_9252/g.22021 Transcript_9252/m.22021 type:complete len:210 (+) Transcript_9252:3955-4584(+)